jgi:HKD family nuclease
MRLIISQKELKDTFSNLLEEYKEYHFATAWAGMPGEIVDKLFRNVSRIKQMVVGIHFYQTDPNFLDKFAGYNQVRTIMQPSGTFHPKVFLFYTSDSEWVLLIGSANFTDAGFTKNTEAVFQISSDEGDRKVLKNAKEIVDRNWSSGKTLNATELEWYRLRWAKMGKKRSELEDPVGNARIISATDFMKLSWSQFVAQFNGRRSIVNDRFKMLEEIREIFAKKSSLIEMSEDERRFICGNPHNLKVHRKRSYEDFGTSGNGQFMNKMIHKNIHYSDALDRIPLVGEVTRRDFDEFLELFLHDPDTEEGWVSSAARLLTMKRPDTFYNITNANRAGFCEDFGLTQSHTRKLDNYWDLIVQKIQDSRWYNECSPRNDFDKKLKDTRAAMLDVLYYF